MDSRSNGQSTDKANEETYRSLFNSIDQGFCIIEVLIDGDGRAYDYRFVDINAAFTRQTGLQEPVGKTARELVPDLEERWFDMYGTVALTGEPTRFVERSGPMERWFEVNAFRIGAAEERKVAVWFKDISQQIDIEVQLRESEQRFKTLADTAPAMLWITEPDGTASFLSRGWHEFTGQTPERSAGIGWLQAVHPDDREQAGAVFLAANDAQRRFHIDYRLRRADGQYRWVVDTGRPRFARSGKFAGFIGSVMDIHDRKQAEDTLRASEERFRALIDATSDVVYSMNADWTEMRLLRGREFITDTVEPSRSWLDKYIHPDDQEFVLRAVNEAIRTSSIFELEHRVIRVDGSFGWTYSRAIPIRDEHGHVVEWFGAASDVTQRKQAEQRLRESEEQLREADRRKDEFLAMLGHELRNPLGPIRNAVQILNVVAAHEPTARQARRMIDRQSAHMARLIDDLLDVARIRHHKLDVEKRRCDVAAIVRDTVQDYQPDFEAAGVHLTVDLPDQPVWVLGDATRLTQIIGNILHNAYKFTQPHGEVTVRLRCAGDRCEIQVRDTGIGMDADTLRNMFSVFNQADRSLDRSRGGLGLGMALVKHLVDMHDGAVRVHSSGPGSGSEVTVAIPVEVTSAPEPSPAQEAERTSSRSLRVLVIEDNIDAADSLCILLQLQGHVAEKAHTGPAGLEIAKQFKPEIVLCDIGLPLMDGYAVARALRADPSSAPAYLIALTGYGQPEDQRRTREAGFDLHLVKPVDYAALEMALALNVARQR